MIQELPYYINILFGITVLLSIVWFYLACKSKLFLFVVLIWTILQSILGINGLYQDKTAMPPKIMLFAVLPALLAILFLVLTKRGKKFLDQIDLKTLSYFHSIRIPVEIVLALLFHQGLVSVYMTFEGTNFDLFSGLSAALIAYLAFRNTGSNKKLLFWWNVLCFLLLLNVVITAIFAIPSPIQQLAFDQPNVAILYFPFNLLPGVVVPLVLLAHLVAFRQLRK